MQKATLSKLVFALVATGVMVSHTHAYAQETFTAVSGITESGWYQMKQTVNATNPSNSTIFPTEAPLCVIAKDGEFSYGSDYYPFYVSATQNTEAPAANYIYIKKNSSNYEIISPNGHKGNGSAKAGRNTDNCSIAITADGSNSETFTVGQYWTSFLNNGNMFLGMSSNSNAAVARFQFSKVTSEETDKYDIYAVTIGTENQGSTVHNDVYLTTTNSASQGLKQVYNGGYYFFTKGATVNVSDFTLSNQEAPTGYKTPVVAVNSESKTITVTYPADYNVQLTSEVTKAKALLEKTGIGYPTEEARITLQAAISTAESKTANATEEDLNNLKAAETTYTTADVQLPEDGKAYKPYVLLSNGNKVYAVTGGNQVFVVQKVNGAYRLLSSLANGNGVKENNKTDFTISTTNRLQFGALTLTYKDGSNKDVSVAIKADGTAYGHYTGKGYQGTDYSAEWYFEPATFGGNTVTFTASAADNTNYATINLPYASTIPTGVTAYKGTVSGNQVLLSQYITGGSVLPANTPVLLTATNADSYNFLPAAYQAAEVTGFQGTLAAAAVTADNAYILAQKDGNVKFHLLNSESNTVNANKAYLVVSSGNAQSLSFNFGATTGINAATINVTTAEAPIFDLSGRRVVKAVKGGVYIQNGKKFIVK